MELITNPIEARIIGCLIEKAICTPDQYPLSINSLLNACNQKSNREPVLELAELDVRTVLDELIRKKLVVNCADFNARVARYQHRFCNTEFGELKFDSQELAIIAELLLRGPQTPGELRSHCQRLHPFNDVSEVDSTLNRLIEQGPYVVKLAKEPGKRESRYAHLFSPLNESVSAPSQEAHSYALNASERLAALEQEVATLKETVTALTEKVIALSQ